MTVFVPPEVTAVDSSFKSQVGLSLSLSLSLSCSLVICVTWMHRRVVLWDLELMHFRAYVCIIFVYRVVYVDMSTRSSQINHLNLNVRKKQNLHNSIQNSIPQLKKR